MEKTVKITKLATRLATVEKNLGELNRMQRANSEGSRTCYISDVYSKVELDVQRSNSVYKALISSYEDEKKEILAELKSLYVEEKPVELVSHTEGDMD